MSDHSSLVAAFREKLRPKYKSTSNSRYIKENVYFNGVALKESLLHDEYPPDVQVTSKRNNILSNKDNRLSYPYNIKNLDVEKGCFIYQNPAGYNDDNDIVQKFTDVCLIDEFEVINRNYTRSLGTDSFKPVSIYIIVILLKIMHDTKMCS